MLHLPAPLEAAGRLTSSAKEREPGGGRLILASLDRMVRSNSALKLAHDPSVGFAPELCRHGWRRCTAIAHAAARLLMRLAKLD